MWSAAGTRSLCIVSRCSWSYRQLDQLATVLAHQLRQHGVTTESRVGIHAERSAEFVLAVLAVLKAGGAYVPLDPQLPESRLAHLLKDCGARVLLSAQPVSWGEGCGGCRCRWRQLGALALPTPMALTPSTRFARAPRSPRHPTPAVHTAHTVNAAHVAHAAHPAQAAYVIYTSGSSGTPKGVVVTHGALSNYVQAVLERLALPDSVRSLAMVSTVAADLGNTVLYGALCTGRTLHLIDAARAFDGAALAQYLSEHAVDVLKIVPGHLQSLLGSGNDNAAILPRHADARRRGHKLAAARPSAPAGSRIAE